LVAVRGALAFLTITGRHRAPDERTLDWFPVVGGLLGLALGGFWWLIGRAWPATVAGALFVAADLAVTGMLHIDGLMDSADGLLPPLERHRRLEVMADPRSGAFGVAAAAATLLVRYAAVVALRPAILLIGGLWCLLRSFIAIVARTRTPARPDGGMAGSSMGHPRRYPLWIGMAGGFGLAAGWRLGPGLAAAAGAAVAGVAVIAFAQRRIGGYTGDVLGASAVIAETVGLAVAAAKW
jgi:adenosylcobinamide-GDP ribazoletransferase